MIMDYLSYGAILATTYLILSFNPIVNLALLILIFIFSAFLFIQLEFYFLGLTYIIVYVGAIAVLFLFVIMMVSTKMKLDPIQNSNLYPTLKLTIVYLLLSSFIFILLYSKTKMDLNYYYYYPSWINDFIYLTDLQSIGSTLFLANPIAILLISFLLWLVLIGVLALTEDQS